MALDNLRREQAGLATAKTAVPAVGNPEEFSELARSEMTDEEREAAVKASLAQIAAEQAESGVDDGAPPLV